MKHNEHVFEEYSGYYDLFYKNKNYIQESEYVIKLLRLLAPEAKNLIELGSGTGNYSRLFCAEGYNVTGIEKSEAMIARSKLKQITNFIPIHADMVTFNLPQKYDAIYSLFDVMCYLTTNHELISCFKNIARHLNPGGVFIFDGWYTPAVYTQEPAASIKRAEDDQYHVTRLSEPVINYQHNTVDVHYEFIIKNKTDHQCHTLNETHTLRHFNIPEIDFFAETAGLKLIGYEELSTSRSPDKNSWKVCYQLQKT